MSGGEEEPDYLSILSPSDKAGYLRMRSNFSTRVGTGNVAESFKDVLNTIKNYSIRNNADDYKRCDCCGVCWLPDKIGVNTNRLAYLTGQQKNNINKALNQLMYVPTLATNELINIIPTLQGNIRELRMWTVRKLAPAETPSPRVHISVYRSTTCKTFNSPNASFVTAFSERRWSYEEFSTKESGDNDNFFEDPFAIPLDIWQNGK